MGATELEHGDHSHKVLSRLCVINLKLSAQKCVYKKFEVLYIGRILSDTTLKPDEVKVRAITAMETPGFLRF